MKNLLCLTLFSLLLFSCGSDEEPEIDPIVPFQFEGRWIGTWSDNLFSGISTSAIIREIGENQYSGSMFIIAGTNLPFTAGYGGPNDGSIRFTTDGNNNVLEYTYVQTAPEYRGGCPGEYNGTGAINEELNRLVINFTGTDCDGFHENGEFIWRLEE